MSRKILGLDVRYNAVSAVLINSSLRENQIENFIHIPVPESEDGESALISALETLSERINTNGCVCVSSFPGWHVSYRNIRIPFKGAKKIAQVLPFELEPMLPVPVENIITDFHVIGLSEDGDNTDIIAASVEKSSLESYLNTLKAFKIDPKTLSPGAYAMAVCMNRFMDMPESWMLLDIHSRWSSLFFILSGQIHLIRSFPVSSPINTGIKSLCMNIQQTLTAFEETSSFAFNPEKLFITGHALQDLDIEKEMGNILNIPVDRVDLLETPGVKIKPARDLSWKSSEMDNALALALSEIEGIDGINFRKGPFAARKNWEAHKKNLITAGIFSLILLMLMFMNIMIDSYAAQKKLDRLDQQILDIFKSTFPDVQRIVDPLHQMRVAMEEVKKNTFTPGDPDKHIRVIDILNELSSQIPDAIDVQFTRLVADGESILISGDTDTFNSVDNIQTRLEKSVLFKKVTINSSKKDNTENRVEFKMKVDLSTIKKP